MKSSQTPELLAPAGDWECVKAAVENGADSVYFGLERFNARMRAENFTEADLPPLMAFLHRRGVKGYVTFNTLVFPEELADAAHYLRSIIAAGVDAAIVQDIGLCQLIRHLSPDFPIHASTQMTITSAAGVEFARSLGCNLVVLARECSLQDMHRIQAQLQTQDQVLPLEVFVHGALCVAYSGQCLTSEALGGRSANRGECAQACRMPYELVVDGKLLDLGNRRYLLSPQDLVGLDVIPELIQAGIHSFKIEGRLKQPTYVASVTRIYRQAINQAVAQGAYTSSVNDRYQLEMAFSRGLYPGWLNGINNQELVHAQFAKKRGVFLGEITHLPTSSNVPTFSLRLQVPLKPGDGIVIESSHRPAKEQGGRVYEITHQGSEATLTFGRHDLDVRQLRVGDLVWKTSDPDWERQVRQTFNSETPQFQRPIDLEIQGEVGQVLTVIARDQLDNVVQVESSMPLAAAHTQHLTIERLQEQFGRLGNTPFQLGTVVNQLQGAVILPVKELNRLRRDLVTQLEILRAKPRRWQLTAHASVKTLLPAPVRSSSAATPTLIVLVRRLEQVQAALEAGISTLYCEFEDPRAYRDAVHRVRNHDPGGRSIWVAPPRITKPGEQYILEQVKRSAADGYLVRNYDHLHFFADSPCVGDFSLNVANPLTAQLLKERFNLQRLTASYDLNISQLEALLKTCPPEWLEVTIHQHMPMFHMEHCVFCAFLSTGTDYTNCGRPCETHEVKLRVHEMHSQGNRVPTEHVLQADAGCRNTVFNGVTQTGAESVHRLLNLGLRQFRIEFVNESPVQVQHTIERYQQLLRGEIKGAQLWRDLKLHNQLGVTRGAS
jgi:U32 family peptidase